MKTQTWLPVFTGFYNTIFESDYDYELEYLKSEKELDEEVIDFFWSSKQYQKIEEEYQDSVCQQCTKFIEEELQFHGLVKSIKMEKLVSPKYYNFHNDSINIEVSFTSSNVENIKKYIKENFEDWTKFLKDCYTSYDGFMSSYDNTPDSEDWSDLDECLEHHHKAGAILQFICSMMKIGHHTLYQNLETSIYIDAEELVKEYLENNEDELEEKIEDLKKDCTGCKIPLIQKTCNNSNCAIAPELQKWENLLTYGETEI